MLWIDYTIEQSGPHFKIKGDWDKEVMKKGLFKPGDIFIVNFHFKKRHAVFLF